MKSIGIDITVNGATIVEVSSDRGGYEIVKGDFIPLNPNDPGNWEMDLSQGLKRFREEFDFDNARVIVALPQTVISTRNFNFPFTRRSDILKTLLFELDEELPMSAYDAYADAKTVALSAGSTSVLAFATPKDEVHKLVTILDRVGIDPDMITAEGPAFANLFEDWNSGSFLMSPPETVPAPLHMRLLFRHDSTLVTLWQGRQMVWARSLFWGERTLILGLMKSFNYPYDQAATLIPNGLKMLIMSHGATAEEIQVSDVLEKAFQDFMKSLSLSLIDIQDKFAAGVGSVSLLGPISHIANINAFVTKSLGVPCNTEDLANDVFQPRQVQAVSHFIDRAAVAIGIALEGLKKPRNPGLNLRQGEAAKQNLFWQETWSRWGHAITLTAIAYVCYTVYGMVRENVAMQLDETTYGVLQNSAVAVAGMNKNQATPDRIQTYLEAEDTKMKNAKIFDKVQDIEPAMKVVSAISNQFPSSRLQSYDIRRVDVKNKSVLIEGEATQASTVDLLRKKLETMSSDNKVRTVSPTFGPAKGVPFAFRFTVKETL